MTPRTAVLGLLTGAMILASGCGGGDGAAAGDGGSGGGTTIVATEFDFEPADVTISAGTETQIILDNEGVVEHDWTVDELDVQIHADAGETTTGTVTAAAGTYELYCSVPGHREAGMVGTLTVTD